MREPLDELRQLLGADHISTRTIDRLAYAHDASLYRLVPQAIVRPVDTDAVRALFRWCSEHHLHCTFRTAGTSLSGQAVTSGILADLSRGWQRVDILDDAQRVRMQPGITGARVNAMLHRHGRKLGPDPASLIAAMIGGIVANNASGMCCGTAQNSYHTLDSMSYVLADGTIIDTAREDADERLRMTRPDLHSAVVRLRDEIRTDAALVGLIRRKYKIKNTIGYSLNAFLDEDQPARIIARLLVGSEGTLGFIEHVTLRTVPDAAKKWTGLHLYDTLEEACHDVERWRSLGAAAVELMDDASLRSFAHLPTTPDEYRIDRKGAAALLVEFHDVVPPACDGVRWTSQAREQAVLWKLRKGLMPTVGAMRSAGTTMINEDIAAPPEHLASLVRDVQSAFAEFGYEDGLVFGHAKDGNIHFVVCQSFDTDADVQRYEAFMERIAEIVVDRYQGSLKAEHGTGRNMAPFVEREWGTVAYDVMVRIKKLLDPLNILNPDVLINADPRAHVKHLKPVPVLSGDGAEIIDKCIECGFCEHVCPTRGVTLTPRGRIVVQRERVMASHDPQLLAELNKEARFDVTDSCAVDGMCATVCPVGIDTGAFVKQRRRRQRRSTQALARMVAGNMHLARLGARTMMRLRALTILPGANLVRSLRAAEPTVSNRLDEFDLIYVPTCVSAAVRHGASSRSMQQMILDLAEVAGLRIRVLADSTGCCGQPLSSQGYPDAAATSQERLLKDIKQLLGTRPVPVLLDTTTCAAAIAEQARKDGLEIIDQVGFAELVLSRCSIVPSSRPLVVHAGCGAAKQGNADRLITLAHRLSSSVIVPPSAACCGMGGSHGLQHPLVVASATSAECEEIHAHPDFRSDATGVSLNTLCESALSSTSGVPFTGLVEVVWERVTEVLSY